MVKNITMPIDGNKGVFIEIDNELDTPRVFVSLIDIEKDVVYQDLCGVRVCDPVDNGNEYEVYVFGNENKSDCTDIFTVFDNEGRYV